MQHAAGQNLKREVMHSHVENKQDTKSQSAASAGTQKQNTGGSGLQVMDHRPEAIAQRRLREMSNNTPRAVQFKAYRQAANNSPEIKQAAQTAGVIQRVLINIEGYEGPQLDTEEEGMATIKAYLRQLIDDHNEEGILKLIEQIVQEDDTKVPEIAAYRREYQMRLMAPVPQADDATHLSEALDSPVGQRTDHAIPQSIHRFWSGGPLSESALATMLEASGKTEGTPWAHTLWYSRNFEEGIKKPWALFGQGGTDYRADQAKITKRDAQRRQLIESGYNIRAIEELVAEGPSTSGVTADELNQASGMAANSVNAGRGYDDLKYVSDSARLMYLHAEGGHHMDVDIGLGDMDMHQQYYHNDAGGQVPLLGTLARDMTIEGGGQEVAPHLASSKKYRDNPYSGGVDEAQYREAVTALATRSEAGAGMYNALIASQPGTVNLQAAIDRIMRSMRKENPVDRTLSTGMGANPELLAGIRGGEGYNERLDVGAAASVPPYLLRLEHLTEESQR